MQKKSLFPVILVLTAVAVVGLFVFLIKTKNAPLPDSAMIFFYSDTCPHCENVENFFSANQIESKLSFEKRNVHTSADSAKLMTDRYQKCGVTNTKEMGVPLFWDGSTCITGDQPIIDYLKNKLNL